MFPELSKKKYQLDRAEAERIVKEGTFGVLSLLGENDYCYGVPLHHVYEKGAIYFHCAPKGWKLDAAKHHPRVCYTVVDRNMVFLAGERDTRYSSACAFGTISRVTDRQEKGEALKSITNKYDPSSNQWIEGYIQGGMPVDVWKIRVEHLEGKSSFLEGDI